jgi:hypothetical protein
VIIGARNEAQLRQNLGAIGWTLTSEQVARLDAASFKTAPYPYFPYQRQEGFARLSPRLAPRRYPSRKAPQSPFSHSHISRPTRVSCLGSTTLGRSAAL